MFLRKSRFNFQGYYFTKTVDRSACIILAQRRPIVIFVKQPRTGSGTCNTPGLERVLKILFRVRVVRAGPGNISEVNLNFKVRNPSILAYGFSAKSSIGWAKTRVLAEQKSRRNPVRKGMEMSIMH